MTAEQNMSVSNTCLDELKELLEDKYPVFLTLYLESIDELLVAMSNNDMQNIQRVAHQLKSTTQQIGANVLYEVLLEIEQSDAALSVPLCKTIKAEAAMVQDSLQETLASC